MPAIDMRVLAPSFGASAVLVFAVPESKLSQPRNFLGGPSRGVRRNVKIFSMQGKG